MQLILDHLALSLPAASAVELIKTEPPVCLSVCLLALSRLNRWTYGYQIWYGIDLDDLLEVFDGQGLNSKVKVIQLKNVISSFGQGFLCYNWH